MALDRLSIPGNAEPCPHCGIMVYLSVDRERRNAVDGQLHSCVIKKQIREQPQLLPMDGRIVVEALTEETTPSGLYLPSSSSEQRVTIGRIIELPSNRETVFYELTDEEQKIGQLARGDVVLFGQNSGFIADVGYGQARRRAIILRESEVLCKVTKQDGTPYA